jgi:hypothetical protein
LFNTYLSTFYHFIFLIVIILSWLFNPPIIIFGIFFIYTCVLLLFRRSTSSYQEETAFKKGVIFSPVNGRILGISKNIKLDGQEELLTEVSMIIHPWNETGIYLPTSSEIQDYFLSGNKGLFRYLKKNSLSRHQLELNKLSLTLCSIDADLIRMDFLRCIMGSLPEIFVMPGDRGKQQANIGHFPLGGTVLLYLPDKYEILINEKDQIAAGETLIAGVSTKN